MSNLASVAFRALIIVGLAAAFPDSLIAQVSADRGSRNVKLISQFAPADESGATFGNLAIEQEEGRPFVHVTRPNHGSGLLILDYSEPDSPAVAFESPWPGEATHASATDVTYFKSGGQTYVIVGASSSAENADSELGAVIFDVTGLSSGDRPIQIARLSAPGGFENLFAYRHSRGHNLLFATGGSDVFVFDLDAATDGTVDPLTTIGIPSPVPNVDYGFHSVYAAYHPETETDRLYTGGAGGYFIYEITDIMDQGMLVSINSAAVQIGHTIYPTPDGSMVVTTTGYRTAPVRIFDLRPAFEGTISTVRTAIGAWVADWKNYTEHFVVRWPFVFVASMQDGFQAFNMMYPIEPYTVGYFQTNPANDSARSKVELELTGAWDIDVRNFDGLIVVSDVDTGIWALRMEGFEGWDGRGWGLPNISGAQNWEDGPVNSTEWPELDTYRP